MPNQSKKKTARKSTEKPKISAVNAVSPKKSTLKVTAATNVETSNNPKPIEVKIKKLTNKDVEGMIDKIITRNTKDNPSVKEKYRPPKKSLKTNSEISVQSVDKSVAVDKKAVKRNKQALELKQEAKKKAAQIRMEAEEIAAQIRLQADQKAVQIKQEADRKAARLNLKSNKKVVKRELKEAIKQAKREAAEKLGKSVKQKPTKKIIPKIEKPAKIYTNKSRVKKSARNVLVASFAAFVLMIGAGVAYTWYIGQNGDSSASDTDTLGASSSQPAVAEPTQIADNAPESAAVQMITSPIIPGSKASITVKTNPESDCTIKAEYNKIASRDAGLIAKSADEYGIVSWEWKVEDSVPLGKWPVTVTCVWRERSAVVVGDLVVANEIPL